MRLIKKLECIYAYFYISSYMGSMLVINWDPGYI
jgi:hypothetical protein